MKTKKKANRPQIDDEELVRRAYRAWFSGKFDWFDQDHLPKPNQRMTYRPKPPSAAVVQEYEGHFYVLMSDDKSITVVYRVKNDGTLKLLRRWPADIEKGGR